MLEFKRSTLECLALDVTGERPREVKVEAFVVQYPEAERLHVFLHVPPNLLEVNLPNPNELLDYAEARLDVRLAERALEAAKQEILRLIREAGASEGMTHVRIVADESENAPCVTLYPWKRKAGTRAIHPAKRLSVITLSEEFEENPPPLHLYSWQAVRRMTKDGGKWLIVSPDLYGFLISCQRKREDAEARARKAYAALSARINEYEQAIASVRAWAEAAQFVGHEGFMGWRDALAQAAKLNRTEKELLLLSGLAKRLFLKQAERWMLISVHEVSSRVTAVAGSAGWAFRFPSSDKQ